jgi:hypothetical protein
MMQSINRLHSSLNFIYQKIFLKPAIKINNNSTNHTIIDPYPPDYIIERKIDYTRLIKKRVEETKEEIFEGLGANDLLFIDSSHSVKIGGDVNYLYLEIFPKLRSGVIIHIHDINLPGEYPIAYATSENFRQFWTEQYLLQSFLIYNNQFEVLLGLSYLMTDRLNIFKKAFTHYNPRIHKAISGGFWIRRKNEK